MNANERENGFLVDAIHLLDDAAQTKAKLNQFCNYFSKFLKENESRLETNSHELKRLRAWATASCDALRVTKSSIKGWLTKYSGGFKKQLSIVQNRWVVLDPPNMLYYSDEEQTTLKGILYLDRCKCIVENNNTFVIFSANTSNDDWINPLNKRKLKYTWCVPSNSRGTSRDILRMWHESTTAAIKASKALRKLMYIQECFLNAPNLLEYCALMESFRNQKGKSKWHFKIPLAWLRHHKHDAEMALEDEVRIRVLNSDDHSKTTAVRKTSSTNWDSNRLSVATRKDVELQDLHSQLGHMKDRRKLRYSTIGMRQVRKDMPRDSMQINGVRFTGISGDRAVHLVFQAIEKYILTAKKSSGSFSQRLDTADRLPALRLARRVVLGSSRTISGGDTWDAADYLCRNRNYALMIPKSEISSPISIVIRAPKPSDKFTASARPYFPVVLVWTDMFYSVRVTGNIGRVMANKTEVATLRTRFQRQFICENNHRSGALEKHFPDIGNKSQMNTLHEKLFREYGYEATAKQRFNLFSEGVVAIEIIPSGKKMESKREKRTPAERQIASMSMRVENIASSLVHSPSGRHVRVRVNTKSSDTLMKRSPPPAIPDSSKKPVLLTPPGLSPCVREKIESSSRRRKSMSKVDNGNADDTDDDSAMVVRIR